MIFKKIRFGVMMMGWLFCVPHIVNANAYCALRDPSAALRDLYPEASSYRSIVKEVDNQVRSHIDRILPFTLHYDELGEHTLYISMINSSPVGLVHMRSEVTNWGFIEIAWSLDFDLKVQDFFIQRCRSKECQSSVIEEIRQLMIGKSFADILPLLDTSRSSLNVDGENAQLIRSSIALPVIRSALKTILVTESVWKEDLEALQIGDVVVRYKVH